jgi:hypothetical protein
LDGDDADASGSSASSRAKEEEGDWRRQHEDEDAPSIIGTSLLLRDIAFVVAVLLLLVVDLPMPGFCSPLQQSKEPNNDGKIYSAASYTMVPLHSRLRREGFEDTSKMP